MIVYKIRNTAGHYSTGGSNPKWTKRGKTWVARNHLTAHLSLIRSERERVAKALLYSQSAERMRRTIEITGVDKRIDPYETAEVIAYDMQEMTSQRIVNGTLKEDTYIPLGAA